MCSSDLVADRVPDVMASAAWLAQQPFVASERLALLGWSHGGSATLSTVNRRAPETGADFKVAIAFYPGCRVYLESGNWRTRLPLHILMGAADDWTPPAPCRELGKRPNARYVEYEGAYHGFDAPNSPVIVRRNLTYSVDGTGRAHVGTNPAARTAAIAEVDRILAAALKIGRAHV